MNKMIPLFQKKYGIEKLTFITLTDGSGNYPKNTIVGTERADDDYDRTNVYEIDNKKFVGRHNITEKLLNHIKNYHKVNVIGFYVIKRVKRWSNTNFLLSISYTLVLS
jgi:hypothetical protein